MSAMKLLLLWTMLPPTITLTPFWLKESAISLASSKVAPPTMKTITFEAAVEVAD